MGSALIKSLPKRSPDVVRPYYEHCCSLFKIDPIKSNMEISSPDLFSFLSDDYLQEFAESVSINSNNKIIYSSIIRGIISGEQSKESGIS